MSERTVETAFVTIQGDPQAGIPEGTITVSDMGFVWIEEDTNELEFARADLVQCFESIYGDKCTVMFDFECPDAAQEGR